MRSNYLSREAVDATLAGADASLRPELLKRLESARHGVLEVAGMVLAVGHLPDVMEEEHIDAPETQALEASFAAIPDSSAGSPALRAFAGRGRSKVIVARLIKSSSVAWRGQPSIGRPDHGFHKSSLFSTILAVVRPFAKFRPHSLPMSLELPRSMHICSAANVSEEEDG